MVLYVCQDGHSDIDDCYAAKGEVSPWAEGRRVEAWSPTVAEPYPHPVVKGPPADAALEPWDPAREEVRRVADQVAAQILAGYGGQDPEAALVQAADFHRANWHGTISSGHHYGDTIASGAR